MSGEIYLILKQSVGKICNLPTLRVKMPVSNIGNTLPSLIVRERKMMGCNMIPVFGKIRRGAFPIRFVLLKGLTKNSLSEKFQQQTLLLETPNN